MSGKPNEIRRFACETALQLLEKRTGRNEAATSSGPDQQATIGGSAMKANCGHYPDSGVNINQEKPDTWKPIGAVAARLVEGAKK